MLNKKNKKEKNQYQWYIKKNILETIMYLSKKHYPNEFGALLTHKNKVINEIYIIPLTKDYANSVSFRLDLVPMDLNIIGSVHSHPSGFGTPSQADLNFFSRRYVNIIVYPPFSLNSYKVYNKKGEEIPLKIVESTNFY